MALSLVALAACALAIGISAASFTDSEQNPQTISAIADWTAPSAEASLIAPTSGGTPGYLKSKATYYVYAKVSDSGNPASGVASVKADVSAITSGQTGASLVAGSYSVGGVSYNYRSASLTAGTLTVGSKAYSLAMADKGGYSSSQSFSVAVLGSFAGASFETDNSSGGNEGKPEAGDTATFTYSSAPMPSSIVSGWSGSSPTSVAVTITQSSSNDTLTVSGAALGTVELKGNYVSKTVTFSSSTLALSGSSIVLTLGTPSSSTSLEDDNASRAPIWKPSSSAKDLAENACSTASVTASSGRQF
jgi:predicted ribosomally synthesized peptide with SipW-like signal peptide